MKSPTHGQAEHGSTPNDPGAQGSQGVERGASEATISKSFTKWTPGQAKEQGYADVKGTK